jgi:hypothetical protein
MLRACNLPKKQKDGHDAEENQALVRISSGLLNVVDEYLESEAARKRAIDSRVDLVNEAVKKFLEAQGFL